MPYLSIMIMQNYSSSFIMDTVLEHPSRSINKITNRAVSSGNFSREREAPLTVVEKELSEEVNPEVIRYFKSIPNVMDAKVLYLSTIRHYIFDAGTLWDVTTIINLRLINRIAHIYYFLYNTNRMLPIGGYYLGCFESMPQQKKRLKTMYAPLVGSVMYTLFFLFDFLIPKIPVIRNIYLFVHSGRMKCITTYACVSLLTKNGFVLTNITSINNIEYFVAKKVKLCKKENLRLLTLLFDYKHHSKIVKL